MCARWMFAPHWRHSCVSSNEITLFKIIVISTLIRDKAYFQYEMKINYYYNMGPSSWWKPYLDTSHHSDRMQRSRNTCRLQDEQSTTARISVCLHSICISCDAFDVNNIICRYAELVRSKIDVAGCTTSDTLLNCFSTFRHHSVCVLLWN